MKLPQTCDAIVVGGGLTGLLTLKKLILQGKSAILVEKSGKIGESSFDFNFETKETKLRSYIWTTSLNTDVFEYEEQNSEEVLTIGKKGMTPFIGFGDAKVQALEFYNSYTANPSYRAKRFLPDLFKDLDTKTFFTHTEVTKLFVSEEEGLKDEIEVQINGQKTLLAKEIYWTASAQDFERTLPPGQYGKFRQKIKKSKTFDCMCVSFQIPENTEIPPSRYIFSHEDAAPWVGEITKNSETSYWTAYLDQNQSMDHDFARKQLKSLKKFLNKAFPDQIELWINERITIHKAALSQLNISEKGETLKIIPNIKFLGSSKKFWPHPFENKVLKQANESIEEIAALENCTNLETATTI